MVWNSVRLSHFRLVPPYKAFLQIIITRPHSSPIQLHRIVSGILRGHRADFVWVGKRYGTDVPCSNRDGEHCLLAFWLDEQRSRAVWLVERIYSLPCRECTLCRGFSHLYEICSKRPGLHYTTQAALALRILYITWSHKRPGLHCTTQAASLFDSCISRDRTSVQISTTLPRQPLLLDRILHITWSHKRPGLHCTT
jgi:hypothetical protein